MNVSKLLNNKLNHISIKSPVVFTFNINWKVYENFNIEQYIHIKNIFAKNNLNIELLPILTDQRTDIENRVNQFSKGMSKICDKYESRAHVIAYSLAGLHTRAYISFANGDSYIKTLTTLGSPNK